MTPLLQTLLQSSLRITAVAFVIGVVLAAARVRANSLRHTAWLGVLCAMLMMPVLPYLVPALPSPVPIPTLDRETPEPVPEPPPVSLTPDLVPRIAAAAPTAIYQPADLLFAIYAAGVLFFSCRLFAGGLALRKLLRTSTRVAGQHAAVFQSPLLTAPVTVGILHPRILLPTNWTEWPQHKLHAVLAHEQAHVQRRDTLTSLLAHLNRCLFWFHPLAWWLQRKLSLTAECACDDAAIRSLGESRRYAEVLLEMAEAMRQNGGRISWPAPGFGGAGLLGHRIDRILRGGTAAAVRRSLTLLTAAVCCVVIILIAACREKAAPPLKPDPALAAQRSQFKANTDTTHAIAQLTREQVAQLEQQVHDHPDDLDTRKKLMRFYQTSGRKLLGDDQTIASFRTHKLWLIRNHPDDPYARFSSPLSDPVGYQEERKLWLATAAKPDAPADSLRAARFLIPSDPELAEKLYLRLQSVELRSRIASDLGVLYASVLTGPAAHSPFAEHVRKTLDQSTEPALLESTAFALERNAGYRKVNPQILALSKTYFQRALELNPDSIRSRSGLFELQQRTQVSRRIPIERAPTPDAQYQAATALPETERFQLLPHLAEDAYFRGDSMDYYRHDPQAARAAWELARRYAHDTLQLAPRYRNDANYGTAIYKGNITLGMLAMRVDGNVSAARKYLLEASKAPASEDLEYMVDGLALKLPVLLLRYGTATDRQAVIEYLERYGRLIKRRELDLLHSAQQLRAGYMPFWYEVQAAQLK
jgi:hypothetical protein